MLAISTTPPFLQKARENNASTLQRAPTIYLEVPSQEADSIAPSVFTGSDKGANLKPNYVVKPKTYRQCDAGETSPRDARHAMYRLLV